MLNLHFSLMAFQVQSSGSVDRETLLVVFVGIIALFFLALIIGLVAAAIYALKLKRDVLKAIDTVKATVQEKAYPVVASTQELIRDLTPKIKTITENAAEISHTVRAQVTDIDSTLSDVTAKARAQADRVNGMVSSTLNTTTNVVSSVERGVRAPIREVAGLFAGLKAGWDVLLQPRPASAKSDVKRAARHVQSWEDGIAADAARAAAVNPPDRRAGVVPAVVPEVQPYVSKAHSEVAEAKRSMVEAGEEIGSSVKEAASGVAASTRDAVNDLQHRRTP